MDRIRFNPSLSARRDDLDRNGDEYWEENLLLFQPLEWPGRTAARYRAAAHTIEASTARFRSDSTRLAVRRRRDLDEVGRLAGRRIPGVSGRWRDPR